MGPICIHIIYAAQTVMEYWGDVKARDSFGKMVAFQKHLSDLKDEYISHYYIYALHLEF